MEILKVKENIGGLRYIVRLTNDYITSFYSNSTLTESQLIDMETQYIIDHQYDHVKKKEINILDHEDIIREFVILIKDNPNVNFTQYNNWLTSQTWQTKAILNYFIFSLSEKIANKLGINLDNYTEAQVLLYLRDWIVEKTGQEIEKVIYG